MWHPWARSLKDLVLSVHSSWWDDWPGDESYEYTISDIDFKNSKVGNIFLIEDKDGAKYYMRYDAVLDYVDKKHPRFSEYFLPSKFPRKGEYEEWMKTKVCVISALFSISGHYLRLIASQ